MAPKLLEGDVLEPEDEVIRLLKRELAEVRLEFSRMTRVTVRQLEASE